MAMTCEAGSTFFADPVESYPARASLPQRTAQRAPPQPETDMQYMLLIYEPEEHYANASETLLTEIVAKHMALSAELREQGVLLGGDGLQGVETATTVVTDAGGAQSLHDGPFAETKEQLGGYYLIDVADLDAALAVARRIPVVPGGKVEVRPVMIY